MGLINSGQLYHLGAHSHSACSKWYSWPLLIKPIAYWYEKKGSWAYTVSDLGNPVLWWLSSAAIAVLAIATAIGLCKSCCSFWQECLFPDSLRVIL